MTNVNTKLIDYRVANLRESLTVQGDPLAWLELLAEAIDAYRAEVAKEIDGLKSDVRSAESAYEREKVRADNLAYENDRWKNGSLPGWRKRVSEAECKLQEQVARAKFWEDRYYSVAPQEPEFAEVGEPVCCGVDMAAPGSKDKTIYSWDCCGKRTFFEAPSSVFWSYFWEYHKCKAKVHLQPKDQ